MIVKQARDAARQWVLEKATSIPGFCGAYTAGSTNWLAEDADLPAISDLDIMVVVVDPNQAGRRSKFIYRDILLEVSCLSSDPFKSYDLILSDYHLAPSFRTTNILLDPSGDLTALLATVCRHYAERQWVRTRCADAKAKLSKYLRSIDEQAPLHDQVIAWLFAAGITAHILLVAGLKNPTVRGRYRAVRELLAAYGHLEFHETLLATVGSAHLWRERVSQRSFAIAGTEKMKPPVYFQDISHKRGTEVSH